RPEGDGGHSARGEGHRGRTRPSMGRGPGPSRVVTTTTVLLAREAERDLIRLPEAYRAAVGAAIGELAASSLSGAALRGRLADRRSLRVGAYRILNRVNRRSKTVTIETVRHRG